MKQERAIKGIGSDLREINCWAREEHHHRMAGIRAGSEWVAGDPEAYSRKTIEMSLSQQALEKKQEALTDMREWMQCVDNEYDFEYKVNRDGTISDLVAIDIRSHEAWAIIEDEDVDYRIERQE